MADKDYSVYSAQPGPPLNPKDVKGQIGPNGAYFGVQAGYDYDPKSDSYVKHEPKKPSAGSQYATLGAAGLATAGGYAIANGIAQQFAPATAAEQLAQQQLAQQAAQQAAQQGGAQVATQGTASAAGAGGAQGAGLIGNSAATAVPQAPNLVSATAVPAAETGVAQVGTQGAATAAGTPAFEVGAPSWAGYAAAAGDVYTGASQFGDWRDQGEDYAATRAEQQAALAVADVFTGGLAGLANTGARWAAPHFMNEIDKFGTKYGLLGNIVRATGIGHSKDYYDGKTRKRILNALDGEGDGLTYQGANGPIYITPEQFRKDPTLYNYDQGGPTHDSDIGAAQALAYLTTGAKPGSTPFEQTAGLFANLHKNGVSSDELYGKVGLDYNTAYQKIASDTDLKPEDRDAFLNGLDQSFGANAYANGAQPPKQELPITTPNPASEVPGGAAPMPRDAGNGTGNNTQQPPRDIGLLNSAVTQSAPTAPAAAVDAGSSPRGMGLLSSAVGQSYGNGTAQGSNGNVMPMLTSQPAGFGPKDNNTAMPKTGFGVRQSPGIYTDPRTGRTFQSIDGRLPR